MAATIDEQEPAVAEQEPSVTGWRQWVTPTLGDIVFISVFSFAMMLGANLFHRDGDLGRHIRLGRSIIDDGVLPTVDIYSHTMAGGHMIPHEWLSQTAFASVERFFGFDGIGILTAVACALPWFILYRYMVRRGILVSIAVSLSLLGAAASVIHWATRPHIFTWLFVVIWVVLLEDVRRGERKQAWVLIPLMIVWANTHGAFIVGFLILGTYFVGSLLDSRAARGGIDRGASGHFGILLVGTFAASLINPDGVATIINGFAYTREDFLLQFTREYNSPDFHNPLFWPFLALILLTVLLSFRWTWTTALLTVTWTAFALHSFRNIPLYALVVVPIIASAATSWVEARATAPRSSGRFREFASVERQAIGGAVAVGVVLVASILLARSPGSDLEFRDTYFPIDALAAVADGQTPGEHVFNEFHWGGYLEYCCHPDIPVFIDGQTDYYGSALTEQYDATINGGTEWRAVFDEYSIDWVLIPPDVPLAQVLIEADDWVETYRDDVAVVFVEVP